MSSNKEFGFRLGKIFDFQRFYRNARLSKLIHDVEERYEDKELSEDDLCLVNAAGEPDMSHGKECSKEDVT